MKLATLAFAGLVSLGAIHAAYADGDWQALEKKQAEEAATAAEKAQGIERKTWLDTRQGVIDHVEPQDVLPLVKGGSSAASADVAGAKGKVTCAGREGSGWIVSEGKTVQSVLESWAACEGWTVRWQTDRQFVLQASAVMPGSFVEAGGQLIGAFQNANPPLFGEFYAPNKVVVVTTPTELDGQ